MKPLDISKYRLINQQIAATKSIASPVKNAPEIVAWLCAVQAQEYAQTKWGLGLRLRHLKDFDIEKDFTDGKILRTHVLRPTWHFVTAEDIRWILMLTAPRVNAANAYMYRKLELEAKLFNRCNNILEKVLRGGKQLTRDMLNLEFKKNKIKAEGHRLSYIMMRAELDGIICSGARQGNQFTYALLEERVPSRTSKTPDKALAEITKRYFTSRGPATVKDFSTWSGLTLTACKNGIESVKSHFLQEVIENDIYYFPPSISLNKKKFQEMQLLPIYDEFIMGYKNRSAILYFFNGMDPRPHFRFDCTIVFDGQIIGTWKRTVKPKKIQVEYDFFKPPDQLQKVEFEKAAFRFKEFSELEIDF